MNAKIKFTIVTHNLKWQTSIYTIFWAFERAFRSNLFARRKRAKRISSPIPNAKPTEHIPHNAYAKIKEDFNKIFSYLKALITAFMSRK